MCKPIVLQINAIHAYKSTGTIVANLQKLSREYGIESYVIFPKGIGPHEEYTYEVGNKIDRKLHALFARIGGKQAYFSSYYTSRLIKKIDEIKPDIIHLHNLHSNYINLNKLIRHIAKNDIATIITMHDCWYFTGGCFHYMSIGCEKWQSGCGKCPKRYADTPAYLYDASAKILKDRRKYINKIPRLTIVGCSKWIAEECKKSILKDCDIRYLYNGFDLDVFKPTESNLKSELGIGHKKLIIGPASKWLLPINRTTLNYFVSHMPPNAIFLLYGCDDATIQMPENVKLMGYITNQQKMAELYSAADVMVNCSREDTLSSLNIECQACGTPVVTYEATGNLETVDGKYSFAVNTGNYKELFQKCIEVLNGGKEKYSKGCRSSIEDKFEKSVNYKKYINLYNEIISSHYDS